MARKKDIVINIKAEFGSEFQEQSAMETLELVIAALVISLESRHKKNKFAIKII